MQDTLGLQWHELGYAHDAIFISFHPPEVRTAYSFRGVSFHVGFVYGQTLAFKCLQFIHKPGHQALHCKMQ
jgi:hypothetical protein